MNHRFKYSVVFTTILVWGCNAKRADQSSLVELPGDIFDLGAVFSPEIKEITHNFNIKNTTNIPIVIEGIEYSCTCTEAKIGRRHLQPAESTILRLRINVADSYAEKSVVCAVRTNHPDFPVWNYIIKYTSYPRSIIKPDRIELAATTSDQSEFSRPRGLGRLDIYNGRPEDPPPTPGVIDAPPGLVVKILREPEVSQLPGGITRFSFPLLFSIADVSSGSFVRPVRIAIDGGLAATTIVTWKHIAPLECSPPQIHFGVVGPKESAEPPIRKIIVRSPLGRPFQLVRIDQASLVEIRNLGNQSPVHVLNIGIEPPDNTDYPALSGVIQLEADFNEFGTTKLEIPWSAFIAPPG